MGDAKCEFCKRGTDIERRDDFCWEATIRPLGATSTLGERECAAITRVRAPLDAENDRLTAEVATLRAKLDDADARWRAAERCANRLVCTHDYGDEQCQSDAAWSAEKRDYFCDEHFFCTEHTTREGAEETGR